MAICYQILDLGTQKSTYNGESKLQHKVYIGFELINELMEDGRPFVVGSRYTLSGFKNAVLRKHLESWRAKAFTDDEFDAFDITKLVGQPAMLTLTEGEKYVNITGVSLPPKGTPLKALVNEKKKLILTPEEFDVKVFESLHEKMRETIAASPEYQAIKSGKPIQNVVEEFDDEIPF